MPVQMLRYSAGGVWDPFLGGEGTGPITGPAFILGTTQPTTFLTGRPAGSPALTDYPDKNTARTINVDTPGTVFQDIDFGNVRLNIRTTDVTIRRCRQFFTTEFGTWPAITAWDPRVRNLLVEFCDIENVAQNVVDHAAIHGHHLTVRRSRVRGFVDIFKSAASAGNQAPATNGGFVSEGNMLGPVAWLASDTPNTAVHPTDTVSHNDVIQGLGSQFTSRGDLILAYPSPVVGTGTPGSGTDTGNPTGWYTQAQANAKRASILTGKTDPAKSYGGIAWDVPVTVSGIMLNTGADPSLDVTIEDGWIAGGNVGINGRDTSLTSPLGTIRRMRFFNDQFFRSGSKGVGIAIRSDLTATVPTADPDRNVWMDDGSTVARNT